MEIQGVYWIEKSKSFSPLTDLLSVSAFEFTGFFVLKKSTITGFFVFKKSTINAFVSSNHPKIVALAKSSILFKNCLLFISLTELEKTFFYCFPKEVHLSPLNTDFLLQHVCLGPILRLCKLLCYLAWDEWTAKTFPTLVIPPSLCFHWGEI